MMCRSRMAGQDNDQDNIKARKQRNNTAGQRDVSQLSFYTFNVPTLQERGDLSERYQVGTMNPA